MSAESLPEPYLADSAVSTEVQDEFQRYPFAKQIASTIRSRRDVASLVLGLYGKWGTGKTSILNFILAELANSNVLTMVFNPWLFSGEEQLLLGFFSQLSELLAPLDSADAREVAQSLTGNSKKIVYRLTLFKLEATQEQVQSAKSTAALEEFKHKLNELLRTTGKRILIIIDDLDRLDKQEIQAMLRLVKLTGDFELTTYLLAFDDAMVARAVGERYPGGGTAAGRRFLEKIIQVPLRLPVIQREAMSRYFMKQLQRSLDLTGTQFTENELDRIKIALTNSVLAQDINPRDISRYTNTLMVALPMLRGEANMGDLVLVEALKMFYPSKYKILIEHPYAVTGTLENNQLEEAHKRRDPLFGDNASELGTARTIFFTLFPAITKLYQKQHFYLGGEKPRTEDDLYRDKSVASTYYFKRYFSYAVQEGEIPEASFTELLTHLQEQEVAQASELAFKMINRTSDSELLRRLDVETAGVQPTQAIAYCKLLVSISSAFSRSNLHESFFRLFPPVTTLLLLRYFKQVPEQEKGAMGEYIIQQACFGLGYQFLYDIHRVEPWGEHALQPELASMAFFTLEYYKKLGKFLMARALTFAQGQALYKVYEKLGNFLFLLWKEAEGKDITNNYLQSKLNECPTDLLIFLRYMSPVGSLSGVTTYNHLNEEYYQVITTIIDSDYIYKSARQLIGDSPILPYNADIFNPPSDEQRLHEFVYLHDKNLADNSAIVDITVPEE